VLARTREIHIMRLVGATDGFIRLPFLIEGFIKGTLGGILALVLTWVVFEVSGRWVMQVTYFEPIIALGGVAAGALMGLLASAVSVGRHLRKV
jgi:cell division transport system permease protein